MKGIISFALSVVGSVALAQPAPETVPTCYAKSRPLAINNEQVLNWKASTRNQFKNRGHIKGTLTRIYPDHSGHVHYQVQIGENSGDTVEVVYNKDFGSIPGVRVGTEVEACGDYITSNAPSKKYPASPDGALVHWVHESPNPRRHESGYMVLDGVVCGTHDRN